MNDGTGLVVFAAVSAVIVFAVVVLKSLRRGGGGGSTAPHWRAEFGQNGTAERPFEPTVSGAGIAIDEHNGWLWLATDEHGYRLLDRADVRSWRHEWDDVVVNRAAEVWNNRLLIRTSDLRTPLLAVSFGRDRAEAQLWHARLTTWLQS